MTKREIAIITAGLSAGRTTWARPQQIAALANILATEGQCPVTIESEGETVANPAHAAVLAAFGPFTNASQTLQELKRLGIIEAVETPAMQEARAAILAALKAS